MRILSDGSVAYGNKKNVVTAVRNGFPVRVTSLKTSYTFPADNLEVSDEEVAAQALWHISQQSSSDYSRMIFQVLCNNGPHRTVLVYRLQDSS